MSVTRPHPISVSDADGRQPQRSGPYVPAVARFVIETCASADSVEFLVEINRRWPDLTFRDFMGAMVLTEAMVMKTEGHA